MKLIVGSRGSRLAVKPIPHIVFGPHFFPGGWFPANPLAGLGGAQGGA